MKYMKKVAFHEVKGHNNSEYDVCWERGGGLCGVSN